MKWKMNWDKNWLGLDCGFRSMRKKLAQHQLENDLSSIIRTVSGHKKNKLPRGASQYQSLYRIASQKIDGFCDNYQVERGEIEAQIPALQELRSLAQTPSASKVKVRILQGFFTGTVAIIALGFATGLVQHLFTWGFNAAHWIMTHL